MTDIEVLMKDGCTKAEAENHLKKGTQVIDDLEEHFEDYMTEWCIDEDEKDKYRQMIETKEPIVNWGIVQTEDNIYYIAYVL